MICKWRVRSSSLKEFCDTGDAGALFARNLQQGRVLPRNFGDSRVAQKTYHLPREVCGTVAFVDQAPD